MRRKMSSEATKQLNWFLWKQRAKQVGVMLVALAFLACYVGYRTYNSDKLVGVDRLTGVVLRSHPIGSRRAYSVDVQLPNGQLVKATSATAFPPPEGSRVLVKDVRFTSGRHVYQLLRTPS